MLYDGAERSEAPSAAPAPALLPLFKMPSAARYLEQLDGIRLLSPKTLELMTSDQLGELSYPWAKGTSFGFGVYVEKGPQATGNIGSAGTFGWSGFFSTYFWIDPKEKMIGILMTQMQPNTTNIAAKFKVLAYQAIVE